MMRDGDDEVQRKFKQTVLGHSAGHRSFSVTHTPTISQGMRINLAEHPHLQSLLVDAFSIANTHMHAHVLTRTHKTDFRALHKQHTNMIPLNQFPYVPLSLLSTSLHVSLTSFHFVCSCLDENKLP